MLVTDLECCKLTGFSLKSLTQSPLGKFLIIKDILQNLVSFVFQINDMTLLYIFSISNRSRAHFLFNDT
jgi:hypothetical protein